jgi:hypothetical protein
MDADLGSYYRKKNTIGVSPTVFPSKKHLGQDRFVRPLILSFYQIKMAKKFIVSKKKNVNIVLLCS